MTTTSETRPARRALAFAIVVSLVAAVWLLLSPVLGHMGPPWPCAIAGALIVLCTAMLWFHPAQHVGWGVLIVGLSVIILLMGQRSIVPGLIGAIGGVAAIVTILSAKNQQPTAPPKDAG